MKVFKIGFILSGAPRRGLRGEYIFVNHGQAKSFDKTAELANAAVGGRVQHIVNNLPDRIGYTIRPLRGNPMREHSSNRQRALLRQKQGMVLTSQ